MDEKEKKQWIVVKNLKENELEELANELYDSLIKLQSKKEELINQKKNLKFNFLKNKKLIKKINEVSQLLEKLKNEFDELSEMLPAINMDKYINNLQKNNTNNFDIQNNSELESNNEIEVGIDCLKDFKDEINLTNDKNVASTSGYKQNSPKM